MRKIIGPVLLGLGGFLLMAAIISTTWAPGVVKKTPTDVNTTTFLSGTANKLNVATGELESNPINTTSVTMVDSDVSDENVVAWVNTSCTVIDVDNPPNCVDGDDDRLISASIDTFATSRTTGLAVNDEKFRADESVPHDGLVNKWPFDSEKKTYPYWDGTAGGAFDAVYDRTENLDGLEVYVYKVSIVDAPIDIAEGVPGTYSSAKEIFVEPGTGAIVNQTEDQQRYLEDGDLVLDLQAAFTDEQQEKDIASAKDNVATVDLILTTVPIVGFVGGILCLLAGALLVFRGRGTSDQPPAKRRETVGV